MIYNLEENKKIQNEHIIQNSHLENEKKIKFIE